MNAVDRLAELGAKATKGRWSVRKPLKRWHIMAGKHYIFEYGPWGPNNEDDANLIAVSHNALPALLALVKAQKAALGVWRKLWDGEISEPPGTDVELAEFAMNAAEKALEEAVK